MINHSPYLDDAEAEIRTLDRGGAVVISQPSGFRLAVSTGIYQFGEYAQRLIREEKASTATADSPSLQL
jgi:hypothetical protein